MIQPFIEQHIPENTEKGNAPERVLTQICATYPFLDEKERADYLESVSNIEETDPLRQIKKLVRLLNNPHARVYKKTDVMTKEERSQIPAEMMPTGEVINGVLCIRIPSFIGDTFKYLEEIFLLYKDSTVGLVIDLRENGGGYESGGRRFAEEYFIKPDAARVGTNIKLAPEEGLNSFQVYAASRSSSPYDKPIVLLTSRKTFSSAERFVATMKSGTDCVVIGTETQGGSANPIESEVDIDGETYVIKIPTWRFVLSGESEPIEETKIQPDVFYDGDDIVNFAVQYIYDQR